MSGHNKWTQIKHRKSAVDAKKSRRFMMLGRKITIESKRASGDTNDSGLKAAISNARAENMPSENIERAVARGAGSDAETLNEVVYEAYGPGGAALVIEGITDNKNRTNQEIKHLFSKEGYALATPGSALWAFTKLSGEWEPSARIPLSEADADALATFIEKIETNEDIKRITTNAELAGDETE